MHRFKGGASEHSSPKADHFHRCWQCHLHRHMATTFRPPRKIWHHLQCHQLAGIQQWLPLLGDRREREDLLGVGCHVSHHSSQGHHWGLLFGSGGDGSWCVEMEHMMPLYSFCAGTFSDGLHLALCPGHDYSDFNSQPIVIYPVPLQISHYLHRNLCSNNW